MRLHLLPPEPASASKVIGTSLRRGSIAFALTNLILYSSVLHVGFFLISLGFDISPNL